jgi:hypothetical protein
MPGKPLRILIIGGYGAFGSRLVRLLADEKDLTLIVAGRSKSKAELFCRDVVGKAVVLPEFFDRDANVVQSLFNLRPDVVVDATGPFQVYGAAPYRIAEAALTCGADYLDLADASDFVRGIERLNHLAIERDRFIVSGASTCPALTAAVVRRLAADLTSLETIEAGIAPSPHAQVGLSVIRALLSYAGRSLEIRRDGKNAFATALVDSRWHVIAPPGEKALRRRLFSLVDVPDLRLLTQEWPELRNVWFGAGTAPVIQHRMFMLLAWLSRAGAVPFLQKLAPLLHMMRGSLTWGERRGGMYVLVDGILADGARVKREWSLVAKDDDGPFIPAMAAAAMIRKCRANFLPAPGARSAVRDLEYSDFEYFFAQKKITAGVCELPA